MPESSAIAKIVLHPGTFSFYFPHTHSNFSHLILYIFETQRLSIINSQFSFPQVFQVLMVTVLLFISIIVTLFVLHYHLPILCRGGLVISRAVRGGAAGAARAAPLFVENFVSIARIHSLLSGATPDLAMIEACAWPRVCTGSKHQPRVTFG